MKICLKRLYCCVSLLLIALLLCGCASAERADDPDRAEPVKEGAFITIDINPAIELVINAEKKVLAAGAANADGEVLLWQEELRGMELDAALRRVTALAAQMGYLTEENAAISVSVISESGKTEEQLTQEINRSLEGAIRNVGLNATVEEEVSLVLSRELARVKERNAGKEGYDESLTLARYRLVKAAMRADRELTMDEAVLLSNKKLTAKVEQTHRDVTDRYGHACNAVRHEAAFVCANAKQTMLDSAYTAIYAARRDLSSLLANYGAAYAGCRLAYRTVEHYAETMRTLIEDPPLSGEDVLTLAHLFGIPTDGAQAQYEEFRREISDEDGKITRDSVNAYIDRCYRNMDEEERAALEETYGEIEELFETLEAELRIISEEGQMIIHAALLGLGITVKVETYEDIPALLHAIEKKIDDIYAKMDKDLTENEKERVLELQDEMSRKIAELEKEYHEKVTKAQAEAEAYFNEAKQARMQ